MTVHSKSVFALLLHWKGIPADYKESRNQYPCISQGMESNDQEIYMLLLPACVSGGDAWR